MKNLRKIDGRKGCMKEKTRKKRDELEGGGRNRDVAIVKRKILKS